MLLAAACVAAATILFLPAFQQTDIKPGAMSEKANTAELSVTISPKPPHPSPPVGDNEWNTYHGDSALTGMINTSFADTLTQAWQVTVGGSVEQTPVASGGRIFVINDKATVFALDMEGRTLWKHAIVPETKPGTQSLPLYAEAPLACFDDKVFAGTDDGMLTALHAETGDPAWNVLVEGYVHGSVNYQKESGSLFVIEQETGALLCLDAKTGALRWRSEGEDRSDGSPSVTADTVVYGSCASALHIIAAKDGAHMHDVKIEEGGGQVAGGVASADGFAYAGCRDGRVMRADLNNASLAWIQSVSKTEVFSTPAIKDDWIVATSLDGILHALDRNTGQQRWRFEVGGEPKSPVIVGNKVVVTSDDKLFLVTLQDGARAWETQMAGYLSGPAVVRDLILVGCEDGTVTAFRSSSP